MISTRAACLDLHFYTNFLTGGPKLGENLTKFFGRTNEEYLARPKLSAKCIMGKFLSLPKAPIDRFRPITRLVWPQAVFLPLSLEAWPPGRRFPESPLNNGAPPPNHAPGGCTAPFIRSPFFPSSGVKCWRI